VTLLLPLKVPVRPCVPLRGWQALHSMDRVNSDFDLGIKSHLLYQPSYERVHAIAPDPLNGRNRLQPRQKLGNRVLVLC
jgi:hypothetical protein